MPRFGETSPYAKPSKADPKLRITSRVREIRIAAGISQLRLCYLSSLTLAVILPLERGDVARSQVLSLLKVAAALDVGVADLFPALGSRSPNNRPQRTMKKVKKEQDDDGFREVRNPDQES